MAVQIILLVIGLALVVYGADWLIEGASFIALRAGISQFVIGLTIVGFGTSCPELVVSLTGAFQGNADISVGNVIGSNVFNTLFIIGLTAMIAPVCVRKNNALRDIPLCLLMTALFIAMGCAGGGISRTDAGVLLAVFVCYLVYCFRSGKDVADEAEDEKGKVKAVWTAILAIAAGLCGLVFGGQMFVDSATDIARSAGVSDKFIAVTLLAGGTSLPELATCVVAAVKHREQLALGNIIGSNIFNILFIIGCSGLVRPISFVAITTADMAVLLVSVILLWLWSYTGKRYRIDRWEGAVMLCLFAAYYASLFMAV